MAEKSIKTRLVFKRGTKSDWGKASTAGFIPKMGEPIFYSDTNILKVGNGANTPDALAHLLDDGDISG